MRSTWWPCSRIVAVCINQADIPEKNAQVRLMGDIYNGARTVLAWLGNREDDALAIATLRVIIGCIRLHSNGYENDDSLWLFMWDVLQQNHYFSPAEGCGNYVWDALSDLPRNPYFRRMWILQKMVLGRRVVFMAGDEAIELDDIEDFSNSLISYQTGRTASWKPISSTLWSVLKLNYGLWTEVHKVLTMRWRHGRGELEAIGPRLVIRTRHYLATDPRDKIFGLLGLANWGVDVDYSNEPESVYLEFATSWIRSGNKLEDMLLYAGSGVSESNGLLPSWVPNWQFVSTYKGADSFSPWRDAQGSSLYGAGKSAKYASNSPSHRLNGSILSVSGVISCKVSSVGKVLSGTSQDHLDFFREYLSGNKSVSYPTGIPLLQAASRVTFHDVNLLDEEVGNRKRLDCQSSYFVYSVAALLQLFVEAAAYPSLTAQEGLSLVLRAVNLSSGTGFADSFIRMCTGQWSRHLNSWTSAEQVLIHDPETLRARMDILNGIEKKRQEVLLPDKQRAARIGPERGGGG